MKKRRKSKIVECSIVLLVLLVTFSVSAMAATKPITGFLDGQAKVDLVVSVDGALGKQACSVQPALSIGADGSFTSNLANLRLINNPTVDCASWWKAGDPLWVVVSHEEGEFSSDQVSIEPGTGLQRLESISLPPSSDPTQNAPIGQGTSPGTPPTFLQPTLEASLFFSLEYSFDPSSNKLTTTSFYSTEGEQLAATLRIVLFNTQGSTTLHESSLVVDETLAHQEGEFDVSGFENGVYTLQAYLIQDSTVLRASPAFRIIKGVVPRSLPSQEKSEPSPLLSPQLEQPKTAFPVNVPQLTMGLVLLILAVLLNVGVFIILFGKKKSS